MKIQKRALAALGLVAAVGAPIGVLAATHGGKPVGGTSAKSETITCPITGEQIPPCCCPLGKK